MWIPKINVRYDWLKIRFLYTINHVDVGFFWNLMRCMIVIVFRFPLRLVDLSIGCLGIVFMYF
jgi:hypothetical protein